MKIFVFGALACLATPALSEQFGTIDASIDGEERRWFTVVLESGDEVFSTAEFTRASAYSDLHIQGHPRPSFTSTDVLSVDAIFTGEVGAGASAPNPSVLYLPEGMSGTIWTSDDAPVRPEIAIETFAMDGDEGSVTGRFTAQLCRKDSFTAPPDTTDCKDVQGRFETGLLGKDQ